VSRARVKSIARAIQAGRWRCNGEPLILDQDGRLLDGQHRLAAVIEANQAIDSFVMVGIDPAHFSTIDQGAKRTGGDVLAIEGHPQAKTLASALRWVWRYEFEAMRKATVTILDYELNEYLGEHPALPHSLQWGQQVRMLLPHGAATALHYLMSAKDVALAKSFFHGLAHGQNLTAADPVYHVRERFLKEKVQPHHMLIVGRMALLTLAWNCVRKQQPFPPSLLWRGLSDKTVAFPEIL
jgi:hypothetical protein